jgi:tetratricopeptide (TPR) repeat protein
VSRSTVILRLIPLLLLGGLLLAPAGCSDSERTSSAAEVDEPAYREGQALLKTGRKQEALNSFLKVIARRGDEAPESHLEVGLLCLQHINDPLSAIYHFRKYLALRPNSPQASLIKQRIDAAMRDFARTLPAQSLENQPQRVDLVAALDRLKQENEMLKQELADLKAGRLTVPAGQPGEGAAPAPAVAPGSFNFPVESIPTVRTRPVTPPRPAPVRDAPVVIPAPKAPANATTRPAGARRHVVRPGDTLFKLAQQYYSNRSKWRDIYAANRDVMRSETDLKVGMELKIP